MVDKTETVVIEGWMGKDSLTAMGTEKFGQTYIPTLVKEKGTAADWRVEEWPPAKVRIEVFIEEEELI